MFATVAYALPKGSRTMVDRIAEPNPNGNDGFDRMHVHLGGGAPDPDTFAAFVIDFVETLAADQSLLRVRLHLPQAYDDADPARPAPNVAHTVTPERERLAIIVLSFESPPARRAFFTSAHSLGHLCPR